MAFLIHGFRWSGGADRIRLSPGLYIAPVQGSVVGALYRRLCMRGGIDGGEPFIYQTFVLVEPSLNDQYVLDVADPYAVFYQVASLMALTTGSAPGMCRVIRSRNRFRSAVDTEIVVYQGAQTEFIMGETGELAPERVANVATMWRHVMDRWKADLIADRLINALTYFQYAWRSPYLDQMCINLGIVLEVLFAPDSRNEMTHQLAFHVAQFNGGSIAERESTYDLVKRFYALRSTVVHGGVAPQEKLGDIVPPVFALLGGTMCKILLDQRLTDAFGSDRRRKELLRGQLFA